MKQRAMKQNRERVTENTETGCRKCQGLGYVFVDEVVEDYGPHTYAMICPVCRAGSSDDQRIKAGLPRKFFAISFQDFRFDSYSGDTRDVSKIAGSFFRDFEKWQADALGLYLWSSKRGSGKTMLACALSNSLMIKHGISVRFVTVPDYLESLKRSFNRKPEETDHTRQYQECDLLILDDFGAEKNGAWQDQELFRLIDYRYTRHLPVIITANSPVDQLECNTRIVDRLYAMTVMIHLPEEGIRARKAEERKQRFLASVISK